MASSFTSSVVFWRVQIQLTSEITSPYSTTSVISDLFYTSYTYNRHLRDLDKEISIRNTK